MNMRSEHNTKIIFPFQAAKKSELRLLMSSLMVAGLIGICGSDAALPYVLVRQFTVIIRRALGSH
jgi:Na+(H+)/acetate symporter ActP